MATSTPKIYVTRFSIHAWGEVQQDYKLEAHIAQTQAQAADMRDACALLKRNAKEETFESERLYDLTVTFDIHRQEYHARTAAEIEKIVGLMEYNNLKSALDSSTPKEVKALSSPDMEYHIAQVYPVLGDLFGKNDIKP